MALRPLFCLFLSGRLRQVSLYLASAVGTKLQSIVENVPNKVPLQNQSVNKEPKSQLNTYSGSTVAQR